MQLGVLDLGKAAKLLSDISAVEEETDLQHMQVVAEDSDFLQAARDQIRIQAQVSSETSYKIGLHMPLPAFA